MITPLIEMRKVVSTISAISVFFWLGLTINPSHAADNQSAEKFVGISNAKIDNTGGMPRLMINGKPTLPIIFFFNTDVWNEQSKQNLAPQVKLAAKAGVHIYSLCFRYGRPNGVDTDFSGLDWFLNEFVKYDPQAVFIGRVFANPTSSWKEWKDIPQEDFQHYADGTSGSLSIASDYSWKPSDEDLVRLIHHLEESPNGNRILAYHIGDGNSEMFPDQYREKGPDIGGANQRRFRQWLKNHYKTEDALKKAWGDPKVTFATARIPSPQPGRFPMGPAAVMEKKIDFFYKVPSEQSWIDFSLYFSNLTADRIISWAKIVKKETNGKKLGAYFYGYTMELPGSISGHYGLQRVLECPEVDILVSPVAYSGRTLGDGGLWMPPIDSVAAHGKLWLNEDDTITVPFQVEVHSTNEAVAMLNRNCAAPIIHRAGTWWMDLMSVGAFKEPVLWDMLKARLPIYEEVYQHPTPYRPQVAMIVDEISKCHVKNDWTATYWNNMLLRNACSRSGAAMGFYSLADFISGVTPRCKAYLFSNTYYLTDQQIKAIQKRLDSEGAMAIWIYAPGILGPKGLDVKRVSKLTGIQLEDKAGMIGSQGTGMLASAEWAPPPQGGPGYSPPAFPCFPRLIVTDKKAEIIAKYKDDQSPSAAITQLGNHPSAFMGDMLISPNALMRLFEKGGAHIWTRDDSVIMTDGKFLMVHTITPGLKPIYLPKGVKAEGINCKIERSEESKEGKIIYTNFQKNDTFWFKLK